MVFPSCIVLGSGLKRHVSTRHFGEIRESVTTMLQVQGASETKVDEVEVCNMSCDTMCPSISIVMFPALSVYPCSESPPVSGSGELMSAPVSTFIFKFVVSDLSLFKW